MHSRAFKHLQRQIHLQKIQSANKRKQFKQFIERAILANPGPTKQIPVIIHPAYLYRIRQQQNQFNSLKTSFSDTEQRYWPIASVKRKNVEFHLFMTCKVSAYDDCNIWFATSRGAHVIDLQMLSPFRETLAKTVDCEIEIHNSGIHVSIHSRVKLPFKQENDYHQYFKISTNGKIY